MTSNRSLVIHFFQVIAAQISQAALKRKKLNSPSHNEHPIAISEQANPNNLKESIAAVLNLWSDAGVQETFRRRVEFDITYSDVL